MTNELTTFAYNTASIRVIKIDGEPWFVAVDVCRILNITNATVALKPLAKDERAKLNLGQRGLGAVNAISESGLYKIIMRSDKPEAKAFQDWVTREVLPSIRKTGGYQVEQPQQQPAPEAAAPLTPMEHMMKALDHAMQAATALQSQVDELQAELKAVSAIAVRPVEAAALPNPDWVTIKDWCRINRKILSTRQKKDLGQIANWIMEERGLTKERRTLFNSREANEYSAGAYPADVIEQAHIEMRQGN